VGGAGGGGGWGWGGFGGGGGGGVVVRRSFCRLAAGERVGEGGLSVLVLVKGGSLYVVWKGSFGGLFGLWKGFGDWGLGFGV